MKMKIPISEIFDAACYYHKNKYDKMLHKLLEEWWLKGVEAGMNLKTKEIDLDDHE